MQHITGDCWAPHISRRAAAATIPVTGTEADRRGRNGIKETRMSNLRIIEILGGPLDGRRVIWDPGIDCMAWTDGSRIYQHAIDELWTGKRMKTVLRHVATVPLPKRK